MRNVLAGALAILFVAMLDAQQPRSLDDPIDVFDRPFSVSFGGGTILDAFNVLIRAHQSAFWSAGVIGTGSKRHLSVYMIGTPGHSHFAAETPVARLTARQQG